MYFYGREKEISKIKRALEKRENIVITGKYGIGRTSLIKYLADITSKKWQFIFTDFSKTPSSVCNEILWNISPKWRDSPYQKKHTS